MFQGTDRGLNGSNTCLRYHWTVGRAYKMLLQKGKKTPPENSQHSLSYPKTLQCNDEQRFRTSGSHTHLGFKFDEHSECTKYKINMYLPIIIFRY